MDESESSGILKDIKYSEIVSPDKTSRRFPVVAESLRKWWGKGKGALTSLNRRPPATETISDLAERKVYGYFPKEVESQKVLDPEIEKAKLARVREIAGLELLPSRVEQEAEKRQLVDQFLEKKLTGILQEGKGYLDKINQLEHRKKRHELNTQSVQDSVIDRAKKGVAVKVLKARQIPEPDQLLTVLKLNNFIIDYNQVLHPSVVANLQRLGTRLTPEQAGEAFNRLSALGYYPSYDWSYFIYNPEFYDILVTFGSLDQQTFQIVSNQLNPYFFLTENPPKLLSYDNARSRQQVSAGLREIVSVYANKGLSKEQESRLDLAQKIALLDHRPLIDSPDPKYQGINQTVWVSIDQVLGNKLDDAVLQEYIKVAEELVYRQIKVGWEDPSLKEEVFEGFRKMDVNGTFSVVERMQTAGIVTNDIVSELTDRYRGLNITQEELIKIQAAESLAEDPVKLEWFQLFGQLLKRGPIVGLNALEYEDLFQHRDEIITFLEFYQSLKSISGEQLPAIGQLLGFIKNNKSFGPSSFYVYSCFNFEISTQPLIDYLNSLSLELEVESGKHEYINFIRQYMLERNQYGEYIFNKSYLPVLAFLNSRVDEAVSYLKYGRPNHQLIAKILEGSINLEDEQLNNILSNSRGSAVELEPALILFHLGRINSENAMWLLRTPKFQALNPEYLTLEQSQLLSFVNHLDQLGVSVAEKYKGKVVDLCVNGQPTLTFLKELSNGAEDIRKYIPKNYINNPSLSISDRQLVALLLAQEGDHAGSRFLLNNIEQFPALVDEQGSPNLAFFDKAAAKNSNLVDRFTPYLTSTLLETATPTQRVFWQYYLESPVAIRSLMIRSKMQVEAILERSGGSVELIEPYLEVMIKINDSPSQEIQRLKDQLLDQIITTPDPVGAYSQIESVFILNNLPPIGKVFRVFDVLHPKLQQGSMYSPVLTQARREKGGYSQRLDIIYRDLMKIHILSGNRSLYEYLSFLKEGVTVFDRISQGEEVTKRDRLKASYTLQKLKTLQVATLFGKQESLGKEASTHEDLDTEITALKRSLGVVEGQTIIGRVEQIFLRPVRYKSIEDVLRTMLEAKRHAGQRSLKYLELAKKEKNSLYLELGAGDLIKGVEEQYIENILENGSVAKEYLGASASSDSTPFGTDVTEVTIDDAREGWKSALSNSAFGGTGGYGGLGLVFKDRGKFQYTSPEKPAIYNSTKYEVYHSGIVGERHRDVRTGIPSTEIDFMIVADSLRINERKMEKIYYSIAKQGFYIPVTDKEGKVIFTPEMYQQYRHTFDGIEAFGGDPLFVRLLAQRNPGFIELQQMIEQVKVDEQATKRLAGLIKEIIEEALTSKSVKLQDEFDASWLGARLYDTGSTGRYTNTPGEYDYDLMLILDSFDFPKASQIKDALMQRLQAAQDNSHIESSGYVQIRAIGATGVVEGQPLDIDIGIGKKSILRPFASNDALAEKLRWIKENLGEESYYQVIGNIVLAKQILKKYNAYKKIGDGGFGGIGVENWILANGGNIVEAMRSFWQAAHENGEVVSFDQFKARYKILDAGINLKNGFHDNFVYNMNDNGYKAMLQAAADFLHLT